MAVAASSSPDVEVMAAHKLVHLATKVPTLEEMEKNRFGAEGKVGREYSRG